MQPNDPVRPRVFISYKRDTEPDQSLALHIYESLTADCCVFIDRSLPVGTNWQDCINTELNRADYLIVLLSEASVGSEMVVGEVESALQISKERAGKPAILPIRVAFPGSLKYPLNAYLNRLNWVIWGGAGDNDRVLLELRRAIDPAKLSRLGGRQVKNDQVEVSNFVDGQLGSRSSLKPHQEKRKRLVAIAGAAVLSGLVLLSAYYFRNSGKAAPGLPPVEVQKPSSIGLDLWRMRLSPPNAEVKQRGLVYKQDPTGSKEWTQERVTAAGSVREGDNVRITVQSFQAGYLYILNRDLYRDGTRSRAVLIFPNPQILGGDNRLAAGVVLGIPSMTDRPPTFSVERTRRDQTAMLLQFLWSPQAIAGLTASTPPPAVPNEQVAEWERKWGSNASMSENASMSGQLVTAAELKSEQTHSAIAGATPMTIFHKKGPQNEPFLATVEIPVTPK